MDAETTFRRYHDLVNQQKWATLYEVLSSTLEHNGTPTTSESYVQSLQDAIEAYSIAGSRLDVIVNDVGEDLMAARVIVRARAAVTDGNFIEYPQHIICTVEDGKIKEIRDITDTDVQEQRLAHIDPCPPPRVLGTGSQSPDLAKFYTSYVSCINNQTMKTELHKYCHSHVEWCGRSLPVDEYRTLMEDTFKAIPDIVFNVRGLIVDDEKQQICARIEFTGTPIRRYSGAEPNGRPVKFSEHAIYWLNGGKIARVVTVIDWQSYRRKLNC